MSECPMVETRMKQTPEGKFDLVITKAGQEKSFYGVDFSDLTKIITSVSFEENEDVN